MSVDMTFQKWAILIMGIYGENLCLPPDQAEILSFSSKKQVIKKVIAKKPLTNLYEINSNSHLHRKFKTILVYLHQESQTSFCHLVTTTLTHMTKLALLLPRLLIIPKA